jgi:hypothetical protein
VSYVTAIAVTANVVVSREREVSIASAAPLVDPSSPIVAPDARSYDEPER